MKIGIIEGLKKKSLLHLHTLYPSFKSCHSLNPQFSLKSANNACTELLLDQCKWIK